MRHRQSLTAKHCVTAEVHVAWGYYPGHLLWAVIVSILSYVIVIIEFFAMITAMDMAMLIRNARSV
jgi:hypothetical protein